MILYFAYGSNIWKKQMHDRCPNHRYVGYAILKGYRWIISARGYANIIKSSPDVVHGVVYEISDSDETSLDTHEGVNGGSYQKEWLIVEIDGVPTSCLVYVDPTKKEGIPKNEYIERINKGIEDAELPSGYVKKYIRKFMP
jgi:cation transport regulator ChaC